jgi:hypothetical protein
VGEWKPKQTMVEKKKLNPWKVPRSTYARSTKSKATIVALLSATVILVGILGASGSAEAISIPGITGFITNDGLFFVQVGYSQFGLASYVGNGSDLYASAVIVNLTGITTSSQVAHIIIYAYATNSTVTSLNVPVPGYTSVEDSVSLPYAHSYLEYKITVDQTPWWFYAFAPYSFLGFTGLQDGGVDLATFIAVGLFFVYAVPLMVKGERMTKRAIYSPRWNATIWLHGIFFGLVAWYFVNFPSINMFFQGWEFVIIPIPEAIFLFFWAAGRHSQNRRALFVQIVPRMGQRLAVIMRAYFVGKDADGDLVIMRSRSPIQWWYRSRGHHVKVFRRSEKGALEPFPLDVLEQTRLTEDQVRDPARFPRGAKYDAHDDFPVVNSDDSEDFPFERLYFVPRVSNFKVTWPHASMHRDVPVPEHVNVATGAIVPAGTKTKLCWPYVVDGHAEVTLCSWHYMDVLAQAMGYMTAEDLADECDNLAIQLWTERGYRHTETGRKADERLLSEEDIRNRPYTDLPEDSLEQYVTPLPTGKRGRGSVGSDRAESA